MKPTRTYILVADDHVAKFFLNTGPSKGVSALPDLTLTREVNADAEGTHNKQGRVFDSNGEGRHAMEPKSDPEKKQADAFLKMAMATLEKKFFTHSFDRFILVAPARAMSELRKQLPGVMQPHLRGELVKDLIHVPTDELSEHLDQVFPTSASNH